MLQQQGRVTEIADAEQRIAAIAKTYAAQPENTIIVSPDNASRRAINQAVRQELQAAGAAGQGRSFHPSPHSSLRHDGCRSSVGGTLSSRATFFTTSEEARRHGIEGRKLRAGRHDRSRKTISSPYAEPDGELVTYDPSRLRGISAYREIEREFAIGDRVQLTAPNRDLQVANRDLGTLQEFRRPTDESRCAWTAARDVSFDPQEMRHFDHGYAVTSHSSQGLTSERVLVNMDTEVHPELINGRFAYVSVSRASHDAQIFTNDAANLAESLSKDVSKTSAIEFGSPPAPVPNAIPVPTVHPKDGPASVLGLSIR